MAVLDDGGAQQSNPNGPWVGTLSDILPNSSLNNLSCNGQTGNTQLVASANPIPPKFEEGIKEAGQCYRKALSIMSSSYDAAFSNLEPQVAQILRQKLLGLTGTQ